MNKEGTVLKKIVMFASILGKITILLLIAHIIVAYALGAMYAFDIFYREISTKYPLFILIIKFEAGVKADILPILFFINNEFKIFIAFSLITIFLATVKFFLVEESLVELVKKKDILTRKYGFSQIFLIIFALETIYTMILTILGITPYVPPLPHPVIVIIVAPVEEEIAARLVWIGIPLIIIDLAKGLTKFGITGLARGVKNISKKIIMGWGEINKISTALILISAAIFAQVHVKYGWDIWKFPAAFIAGIGLGIVFVKYGLLSSILFHFAWNSLTYIPLANIVLGLPYFVVGLVFLVALPFKIHASGKSKENNKKFVSSPDWFQLNR